MVEIKVNKDKSEIISYDNAGVPIYIRESLLSAYPGYRMLCHWHEDMEFISVIDGQMNYYINGETVLLKKDDVIMVNSGQLHYGYSNRKEECCFQCIIFHPSLITANKILYKKFVEPVTGSHGLNYLLFHKEETLTALLHSIYQIKAVHSSSYELEAVNLFLKLWNHIYKIVIDQYADAFQPVDGDLQVQKQMVSYICQNYALNLSLDDIAASGGVCRSKCCQLFKKYTGQSPMDFVNAYRLECSQHLIASTSRNITEICTACGFNHLSYFTKQFHAKYGCTPRDYRKQNFTADSGV